MVELLRKSMVTQAHDHVGFFAKNITVTALQQF
jgi:hypothetical protein